MLICRKPLLAALLLGAVLLAAAARARPDATHAATPWASATQYDGDLVKRGRVQPTTPLLRLDLDTRVHSAGSTPECSRLNLGQFFCDDFEATCSPAGIRKVHCTALDGVTCSGPRTFSLESPCQLNGPSNYRFSTAVILSLTFGWLGVDRFYLGYNFYGMVKLLTFGGMGLLWLADFIWISSQALGPANGEPYRVLTYGPRTRPLLVTSTPVPTLGERLATGGSLMQSAWSPAATSALPPASADTSPAVVAGGQDPAPAAGDLAAAEAEYLGPSAASLAGILAGLADTPDLTTVARASLPGGSGQLPREAVFQFDSRRRGTKTRTFVFDGDL
ncbi:hypothetical protein H696_02493 [Fonticula alba]|uniref:TM2 domain-containing protein n=1 Tax=Fonticula alba TaxID=691883 RepID=A0A058ZC93_FONAL|nr:hypothetical protein H696_02493 [Fonticula alba]KCV71553.1 hypothetical protein H696_02493 [Fonticula alba]|eukprot:XP_009494676.1 hypothetical protein H696_02493 [Fonticula alba]